MFKIKKYETLISALGNVCTWYCFALFMPFLYIFSSEFFPLDDISLNHFLTLLALSVGLFTRPFGASLFGPIGDKLGRTKAISISILLMAISTFLIGLLPNFSNIGMLAPISLIFLRALQGISIGGEYTTTMVHLVEQAPYNRRGFFGSLSDAGSQIGVLFSMITLVVISSAFSEQEIKEYAWRIPFLMSIILVPFAFLVPDRELTTKSKSKESIISLLLESKKEVGCSIAITAFSAIGFYTILSFLPFYLETHNILTIKEAATCSASANIIMIISILIGGFLSDKYSRKPFILFGICSSSIVIVIMLLSKTCNFEFWLIMHLLYGFTLGMYYSCRSAYFVESFPSKIRCTAIALALGLSQAIFGGITNILINFLRNISEILVILPIVLATFCACYCVNLLKDRTGEKVI